MRSVFEPSIRLSNRLSFPQKFTLISLLFVLPLTLLFYLLFSEINEKIEFTSQELRGNAYLRALQSVRMDLNAVSRGAAVAPFTGNRDERGGRPQPTVDLAPVEQIEREVGQRLNTRQIFEKVRAMGDELNRSLAQRTPQADSDALRLRFANALDALNTQVGNTSNLILDPDLDSYYVMDAILLRLPEAQRLVVEARAILANASRHAAMSERRKQEQIIRMEDRLGENLTALNANVRLAVVNNAGGTLTAALTGPLRDYRRAMRRFIDAMGRIEPGARSLAVYDPLIGEALQSGAALWDRCSSQLETLLSRRIEKFEARKRLAIVVSVLSLMVVLYFWNGFYLAVIRTVDQLGRASKSMTAGQFQSDLALENKDELGQVVASFNAVAKQLRSEWLQAQGESAHAKAAEAMLRQAFNTVQLLQAVAVAANSAETAEEALQTTLTEVCAYTGWPVGHAYVLDGDYADGLVSTKLWHLEDPERFETFRKITEATRIAPGVGLPGRVLASRKPIWISDATKDSNFPRIRLAEGIGTHTDFDITLGEGSEDGTRASNLPRAGVAERLGLKAGFGFPVLAGSEVAAVLEFFVPEVIEPDRALLDTMVHVGTQLGRVIEREQVRAALEKARNDLEIRVQERTAELMRANKSLTQDLAEAANYVRSILPPPLHGPVATDWRFIPSATLGGDSFGYHWIDADHFAFYLLDVSGHGVGAALLSVSVINALRSSTLPDIDFREPGEVLTALNVIFPMERQNNLFFTIWYGVFCRSTWRLKYASGGHPPALLIHGPSNATGKVQQLQGKGPFVGAIPDFYYRSEECTLPCPSRIFVLSDGTYEVQKPDGTMLDFSEFIGFLVRPVAAGGSELDRLLELVRDLNGPGPLEDDFSIVKCEFST